MPNTSPKSGSSRVRRFGLLPVAGLVATVMVTSLPSIAMQGDTIADRVLGQVDFTHNALSSADASDLNSPSGVAIDATATPNRLYVADTSNNRVLGYRDAASFANGAAADLVIGQPDFVSSGAGASASVLSDPEGVTVDAVGNLYVADSVNNRVLEYDQPFAACASFPCVAGTANLVFGQHDSFTSNLCNLGKGASADTLCLPEDVAVDGAGNLYIADTNNERVLEYNTPLTTDTTADVVFGQHGSFTSTNCADGGTGDTAPSADGLCSPRALAIDAAGDLYVADRGDSRVLEYNTPLSTDTTADKVFGQGGKFTSTRCADGIAGDPAPSADRMCAPMGVALDGAGNLYVSDTANNRVLEFNTPLVSGNTTADVVFGQNGSFTSSTCADGHGHDPTPSAEGLCVAPGIVLDADDNLYIADGGNNRVLKYDKPIPEIPTPTPSASPTPDGAKITAPSKVALKPAGIGGANSTAKLLIKNIGKPGDLIGTILLSNNQPGTAFTLSEPGTFDIPAHESMTQTVTFMPDAPSDSARITVTSNDPSNGTIIIPVTGTGLPGKLSVPKTLTITSKGVGMPGTANLILKNVGKGALTATVAAATSPFTGGGGAKIDIPADKDSPDIVITFTPASTAEVTQTVQVTVDAPGTGSAMVTLKGIVRK